MRKSRYGSMRHPRTTQEMRSYGDPDHRKYSRSGRHHLPNAYDDIWVCSDKSWKSRRKQQYRIDKTGYALREFQADYGDESYQVYRLLWDRILAGGYWHKYVRPSGIRWYGPDLL
jgi:hypothetical protein